MRQEYRYLRDDILKRRVKEMRDHHESITNIARRLGRTYRYTERLVKSLPCEGCHDRW